MNVITDLTEDMVAEQTARATYDSILRPYDGSDVNSVIRFLRKRKVFRFRRFGEAFYIATNRL